MKIEGRELTVDDYLNPVTYVPSIAHGNASHVDCTLGVIIRFNDEVVFILNCRTRTVQGCRPDDLVWG